MKKRLLSLMLVFAMVLGMVPMTALATDETGEYEGAESVTVTLSLSRDDQFMVGPGTREVMAFKEITVPYFDLADYGLEEYYFVSESYGDDGDGAPGSDLRPGTPEYAEGKVTLLHLYIYALERFYCGVDHEDAGKGYLYDEKLVGTDVFTISGSVGSSFMNQFWGGDCNLNYYVNYKYPLASDGWGATCDQILLRDGDIITLGNFSNYAFYSDPTSIFNYIAAGKDKDTVHTTVAQGDEVTLTVYCAGPNLGTSYDTAQNIVTYCPEVYYTPVDDLYEDVTSWTYIGTADEDGQIVFDTSDLEPGDYLVCVPGQPGQDYPDEICSTPGGIILTVEEGAHSCTFNQEVVAEKYLKSPATCEDAAVYYKSCTCGEASEDENDVFTSGDPLGHAMTHVEAKPATTEEAGNKEYWSCGNCGNLYLDEAGTQRTTLQDVNLPALTVIYSGSDWPYKNYCVEKLLLSGAVVDYVDGTTVWLNAATAQNAEITLTVQAGGRNASYLGVKWNDGDTNTKTYTTNLVNGEASVKIYAYKASGAGASRSGTKTFAFKIAEPNGIPALVQGVDAEVTAEVTADEAYTQDLTEIFTDADGDELTYTVAVDGGKAVAAQADYTYENSIPGTYVLKFTATDGKISEDRKPTYTVNLTIKNSSSTYDVPVTVPADLSVKFYAVNTVNSGAVVKGDELTYTDGVVKVPENIARIMWEADGVVGMSAPTAAGTSLELVTVTFEAKLDDGGIDAEAAITIKDTANCTISGSAADTYLLPAVSDFTYTVTPKNSGYNSATLTEQTPAAGMVEVTLQKKLFTVVAPAGSVVSAGTLSGSFAYSFATPISSVTEGETVTYKFAPLSGNAFVRVQRPDDPDAVTYWDYNSSKADGQTIIVTEAMLFMNDSGEDKFDDDTVYRNFEKYEMDLGDIYMNINNQGYVNLNVGETKQLNMFRNWQAIESFVNSKISLPDFHYEIVNLYGSENVVSIEPDANNSGYAALEATGEGTAIVLVTYDAMYSDSTVATASGGGGGGNRYTAIWPDRTGVFVVSVGKDGTGIKSNMTCNDAIFDAEHSPQFYTGSEGAKVSFKPDEGVTVTVNRSTVGEKTLSFDRFTDEGVAVDNDGTVIVSGLKTGRHIIRLEKDGLYAYQVVTAQQATVTITDSEGNTVTADTKVKPGDALTLTIKGLTNPAEKFATKYNFNAQLTYMDEEGNAYKNSSGTGYGKYNFSSQTQIVQVTVPSDWEQDAFILNGSIVMGGFAGDGIGSHRKVSYGVGSGMAWGEGAGMSLGTLPEIRIKVDGVDHVFDQEVMDEQYLKSAADCENAEVYYKSCKCGEINENETFTRGTALGHSWTDATCAEPKTCSVCSTIEGEALGHTWDGGVVTKKPTTGKEGVMTYTCTVCKDTYTESIARLPITPVGPSVSKPEEPEVPAEPEVTAPAYSDVKDEWFAAGVEYVTEKGLMNGVGDGKFGPSMNTSRGMIVTILWRLAGEPVPTAAAAFTDVIKGAYYEQGVAWAEQKGIVTGYGETFGPNDNITREQLAVMLYRYMGSPSVEGDLNAYSDGNQVSSYAVNAMIWAVQQGIFTGTGDGILAPQANASRAQVATILMRLLNK